MRPVHAALLAAVLLGPAASCCKRPVRSIAVERPGVLDRDDTPPTPREARTERERCPDGLVCWTRSEWAKVREDIIRNRSYAARVYRLCRTPDRLGAQPQGDR